MKAIPQIMQILYLDKIKILIEYLKTAIIPIVIELFCYSFSSTHWNTLKSTNFRGDQMKR